MTESLGRSAVPLDVIVVGASDTGQVREHNEDHFLVGSLDTKQVIEVVEPWACTSERGPFVVVCDGMGGVDGGEIAAELAARVTWREMKRTAVTRDPEVFARLLRRAVRVANHDIHEMGSREVGLHGMGTTLSAAGVVGDRLIVATVGDSRAYVLRSGALVQVTRDQSLQSALLAAGHSANEAATAGGAILQALGVASDVEPSLSIIQVRRGDRVLLCSDGLHGLVGDPALALLLSEPHTVAQAVQLLVAAARIGLPTASIPPTIPVTGQHAVLHSEIGIRIPPTALPVEVEEGPARRRLQYPPRGLWLYAVIAVIACAIAWWLGGR